MAERELDVFKRQERSMLLRVAAIRGLTKAHAGLLVLHGQVNAAMGQFGFHLDKLQTVLEPVTRLEVCW
jgi:hypothetical protein